MAINTSPPDSRAPGIRLRLLSPLPASSAVPALRLFFSYSCRRRRRFVIPQKAVAIARADAPLHALGGPADTIVIDGGWSTVGGGPVVDRRAAQGPRGRADRGVCPPPLAPGRPIKVEHSLRIKKAQRGARAWCGWMPALNESRVNFDHRSRIHHLKTKGKCGGGSRDGCRRCSLGGDAITLLVALDLGVGSTFRANRRARFSTQNVKYNPST